MYICSCTAVTDSEIKNAIAKGARTVAEVFDYLGEEQSCGKCSPEVLDLLEEADYPGPLLVASNDK